MDQAVHGKADGCSTESASCLYYPIGESTLFTKILGWSYGNDLPGGMLKLAFGSMKVKELP